MNQTAKIFMNGRSQAVRLPSEFRFDTREVFIRRDASTGDVILSQKPEKVMSWEELIALRDAVLQENQQLSEDFPGLKSAMDDIASQDPFEGWEE